MQNNVWDSVQFGIIILSQKVGTKTFQFLFVVLQQQTSYKKTSEERTGTEGSMVDQQIIYYRL